MYNVNATRNYCFAVIRVTGASHDSPRTPNVHISGPDVSKKQPKFHARTPKSETKRAKNGAGEEKELFFWAVRRRAVRWSPNPTTTPTPEMMSVPKWRGKAPKGGAPSPRVWGLRSECWSFSLGFELFPFRNFGQKTETPKLSKVGLAGVGHFRPLVLGSMGLRSATVLISGIVGRIPF